MSNKIFNTYNQLIRKLRLRGMNIKKGSSGSRVKNILSKENYYNVVNGYKELFLDLKATPTTDEKYITGVTFDELYALYNFDREIRILYLKYLLILENNLKTVISHSFSKKYGYDNYLKLENFEIGNEKSIASVTKLIGDIQQEISRQMSKHHQVVTHYMTNHGYIPLWVLVNVLTFGKITTFYRNLKKQDKIDIAKEFGINYIELHKYMDILGLARNKCAHDERFYDIKFKKSLHTKSIKNFNTLKLPKDKNGSYLFGTNDAFALAIIFSQMLKKTELKEFISAMNKSIEKLQKQINSISIEDVLQKMGYPNNWKDLIKIAKN